MSGKLHIYLLALCGLALPVTARAVLGGDASSVQADQVRMKATVRPSSATASYRINSLQTPAGVSVREYVNSDGKVFAVVWQGPVMPNLRQLLGQYFAPYVTAARSHRYQRTHLSLHQSDLVVQSRGHMRAFYGRAYLSSLLPAGTTPGMLR